MSKENKSRLGAKWNQLNWRTLEKEVEFRQLNIIEAWKDGDQSKVYKLQEELFYSFAGRAIAVRRVSTGHSETAGTDGISMVNSWDKYQAIVDMKTTTDTLKTYKADPIRRIWIPKGENEKRPLGIPTVRDRCMQALVLLTLDPIVEINSDVHSYGFRRGRSSDHAIRRIRHILDKETRPRYVWDADIAKCFDSISHEFLMKEITRLLSVQMHPLINGWLKAEIKEVGKKSIWPKAGTPQGGVISPILANIALNGLEECVRGSRIGHYPIRLAGPKKGRKLDFVHLTGIWVVRYADDFIITCSDRDRLEKEIIPKVTNFMMLRGLSISDRKSKIVDLKLTGFKFLGWDINVRPRDQRHNNPSTSKNVLLMKPSAQGLKRIKDEVKAEFSNAGRPIEGIVRSLNPKLRGWTNYYRSSYHSRDAFSELGAHIYQTWLRWAKRRHPRRPTRWLVDNYISHSDKSKWVIGAPGGATVFRPQEVQQLRVSQLRVGTNFYEDKDYYTSEGKNLLVSEYRKKVYTYHGWKCAACGQSLGNGKETIELHHIIPEKDGGDWNLKNIVPLHRVCHVGITNAKKPVYSKLATGGK